MILPMEPVTSLEQELCIYTVLIERYIQLWYITFTVVITISHSPYTTSYNDLSNARNMQQ